MVQFHILPLQRTHIWDDLEKAEALGYASVRVGGYEVPTRNLYLSRFRAPLWQVTQATIDITEFVYPGAKITASAFHKSDGHQKCHGETHTYVPYRYFETGRYSTPSGPLAPTQN